MSIVYYAYAWLGKGFWNQGFEEEIEPKKGENLEHDIQEIRQLLDKDHGPI